MVDHFSSAIEWSEAIRRREVSPVEATDLFLDRIDRLGPSLNAFCHVGADEARVVARQREATLRSAAEDLPVYFGVPTAIKDLHAVAGWPLCSASDAVDHPVLSEDGPAVAVLRQAGFTFLGSTTSPEFGTVSVTESARHGATRNPWDLSRSPGGSSGGAAAAVAAGLVPIAHGSDGAGSIREPASHCGLVGLKPSRARVPSRAHWLEGVTTEGVLSRTVADTARALDLFANARPRRTWYEAPPPTGSYETAVASPPRRLRVGWCIQPAFPTEIDPAVVDLTRRAAAIVADLGHDVGEVRIPGLDPEWFLPAFEVLYMTGMAGEPVVDESRLEPLNRAMLQRARETDSVTFVEAVGELQLRSAEMYPLWERFDVVLTPTNPTGPVPIGTHFAGQDADPFVGLTRAEATATFTAPANILGLPAISIPLLTLPDGLPVGVQLIGGRWADDTVLALAAELEQAHPWRERRPDEQLTGVLS